MYAIMSIARKGQDLDIEYLALVDRRKTKKLWWTSDNTDLIMSFQRRSAAEEVLSNLKYNNPHIVRSAVAHAIIEDQCKRIIHHQASMDNEAGWEGHKNA